LKGVAREKTRNKVVLPNTYSAWEDRYLDWYPVLTILDLKLRCRFRGGGNRPGTFKGGTWATSGRSKRVRGRKGDPRGGGGGERKKIIFRVIRKKKIQGKKK